MKKYQNEREEINKLYRAPENKRLKYSAFAAIAVSITLMLSMIIWLDDIPPRLMLVMRGCAGLAALLFVILVGILTYRVNSQRLRDRHDRLKR